MTDTERKPVALVTLMLVALHHIDPNDGYWKNGQLIAPRLVERLHHIDPNDGYWKNTEYCRGSLVVSASPHRSESRVLKGAAVKCMSEAARGFTTSTRITGTTEELCKAAYRYAQGLHYNYILHSRQLMLSLPYAYVSECPMIRQRPHPFRHTHQLELERVITLAEAAEHYCVHPQTLRYHIQRGRLTARRSGRVWLIHRASLDILFPQGS